MRYPINWVVGFLIFAIACAVVGSVFVFLALIRVVLRTRWPAEWERRRAQLPTTARIEACEAITDEHVRLVLSIEHSTDEGYREPRVVRLRGIVHLPADIVPRLEADVTIPLRFDPKRPAESTIDVAKLSGASAEDIEHETYVQRGPMSWTVL
jgi:hypothetical protein